MHSANSNPPARRGISAALVSMPLLWLAATQAASAATVVEYYNRTLDAYIISGRPTEQALLDSIADFRRTGMTFSAAAAENATSSQAKVCRFYVNLPAQGVNSHWYGVQTATPQQYDCEWFRANTPSGFTFEGYDFAVEPLVGNACPVGTTTINRSFRALASGKTSNHRYTASAATYARAAGAGYQGEGPTFCVTAAQDTPGPADSSVGVPTATASLRFLAIGGTAPNGASRTWYYRTNVSTASESMPDALGDVRYRTVRRERLADGTTHEWNNSDNYDRRDDLYWDGVTWSAATILTQGRSSLRDADGDGSYANYSNSGTTRSITIDIAGQSVADVITRIRSFAPKTSHDYSQWGPSPSAVGNAVFPVGSKLSYIYGTTTATQIGFDNRSSNQINIYSAAVAAGGDARSNAAVACAASGLTTSAATRLEDITTVYKGTPCIFAEGTVTNGSGAVFRSGIRNEWWNNSTISLGRLGSNATSVGATAATAYYSGNTGLRVAFDGTSNAVTYFACAERQSDATVRNCDKIGTGSYSVSSMADARVMRFANHPRTADLGQERVLVERGGRVYFAFKGATPSYFDYAALNLTAANSLLSLLGIPQITP